MEKSLTWSESFVDAYVRAVGDRAKYENPGFEDAVVIGNIKALLIMSISSGDEVLLKKMISWGSKEVCPECGATWDREHGRCTANCDKAIEVLVG